VSDPWKHGTLREVPRSYAARKIFARENVNTSHVLGPLRIGSRLGTTAAEAGQRRERLRIYRARAFRDHVTYLGVFWFQYLCVFFSVVQGG
jgi:hypothetical protein